MTQSLSDIIRTESLFEKLKRKIKGTKRLPPYSDVVGNQERKVPIMSWKLQPEENAKGVRTIGEGNNKKIVEAEIDDSNEKEER